MNGTADEECDAKPSTRDSQARAERANLAKLAAELFGARHGVNVQLPPRSQVHWPTALSCLTDEDFDGHGSLQENFGFPVGDRTMKVFQSGGTETTQIGYVNRNFQLCTGHRGLAGNDHEQLSYRLLCL